MAYTEVDTSLREDEKDSRHYNTLQRSKIDLAWDVNGAFKRMAESPGSGYESYKMVEKVLGEASLAYNDARDAK